MSNTDLNKAKEDLLSGIIKPSNVPDKIVKDLYLMFYDKI